MIQLACVVDMGCNVHDAHFMPCPTPPCFPLALAAAIAIWPHAASAQSAPAAPSAPAPITASADDSSLMKETRDALWADVETVGNKPAEKPKKGEPQTVSAADAQVMLAEGWSEVEKAYEQGEANRVQSACNLLARLREVSPKTKVLLLKLGQRADDLLSAQKQAFDAAAKRLLVDDPDQIRNAKTPADLDPLIEAMEKTALLNRAPRRYDGGEGASQDPAVRLTQLHRLAVGWKNYLEMAQGGYFDKAEQTLSTLRSSVTIPFIPREDFDSRIAQVRQKLQATREKPETDMVAVLTAVNSPAELIAARAQIDAIAATVDTSNWQDSNFSATAVARAVAKLAPCAEALQGGRDATTSLRSAMPQEGGSFGRAGEQLNRLFEMLVRQTMYTVEPKARDWVKPGALIKESLDAAGTQMIEKKDWDSLQKVAQLYVYVPAQMRNGNSSSESRRVDTLIQAVRQEDAQLWSQAYASYASLLSSSGAGTGSLPVPDFAKERLEALRKDHPDAIKPPAATAQPGAYPYGAPRYPNRGPYPGEPGYPGRPMAPEDYRQPAAVPASPPNAVRPSTNIAEAPLAPEVSASPSAKPVVPATNSLAAPSGPATTPSTNAPAAPGAPVVTPTP